MTTAQPTQTPPAYYTELCELQRQAATLGSIGSLLNWDQETYMPRRAGAFRSDQQALIARLHHERSTSPRIGELLAACESNGVLKGGADSPIAADVREMRRDYDRATKLPSDLVAELAKVGSQSQEVWKEARQKNDFAMFRPWLERMMALTRRQAECYGVPAGGELYDALLDEYEPGATAAMIEATFRPLRERLSALVKELASSGKAIDDAVLGVKIEAGRQHELGQFVLRAMGFDFEAGRLDTTTHPFCSGMAPGDTRLTTRYRDEAFTDALYGSMHEAGHGLYEQGLPKAELIAGLPAFGRPVGESISLGIHESQSRMWENFVGRSREFWVWLWPIAQKMAAPDGNAAAGPLAGFTVDQIYAAVNTAEPSLIRVEADEATYNLHVMLRFELERGMIRGDLAVKDLPGEWNRRVKDYLGLEVPDDARGCLQDVHWAFGLIGYFPTYTLGNLYAAQFWETINQQIPDLKARMARGDFAALKAWLNTNIHAQGRRYRAADLCQKLTGKPLSADPLMRHLEGKLRAVYR
jgi:carboxypeptidase Taq